MLLFTAGLWQQVRVSAQEPEAEALADPLVLGAWLYEGHCLRCHGPYQQDRIGSMFKSKKELRAEIENGDCAVDWGREHGGPFSSKEIRALADYIMAWEELGAAPDLPALPPQPTPTPSPPPRSAGVSLVTPTPTPTPDPMSDEVKKIVAISPLAHGAWLYTQNCYRCHQAYQETRMGRGMVEDRVEETIENGKTSTNMKPFGRRKGGHLKSGEIEAIVYYITTWEDLDAPPALPDGLLVAPTPDPADFIPVVLPEVPPVAGDVARGGTLYLVFCQPCHGPDGEGNIGPSLVKQWPSVRPDLTLRSTIAQGVSNSLMPAWGRTQGGPLPDQDINDLVAYILSQTAPEPLPISIPAASTTPVSPWRGPLGLLALIAGPLLLTLGGLVVGPRRQ